MTTLMHNLNDACISGSERNTGLKLQCPHCGGYVGYINEATAADDANLLCSGCYMPLRCEQGIWRALLPDREAHFSQFMEDYERIRVAEGRGSANSGYYLNLPYRDLTGRNSAQWFIRTRTFRAIEHHLLPDIVARFQRRLNILDLGAGNGWLSYRLALRGHASVAVDLQTNDTDGLGSATYYRSWLTTLFPCIQAEFDHLPFADSQFDLVIFNASLHYSENYERTLAEAIRCTRSGGTLMIADTPWYSSDGSGRQMVAERRASFITRYGTPSAGIASLEYLTDSRLRKLEYRFGIHWQTHTPYYGARWNLRPVLARLWGKREPSSFRIYMARVNS